jgi:hypothetical protein
MQPTFNKKTFFYDYFPHLPMMRMRLDFDMGYYEQNMVKQQVQGMILKAYDRLVDLHDLKHFYVYPEIGEEFDDNFYRELKNDVQCQLNKPDYWDFLDGLIKKKSFDNEQDLDAFRTKVAAALGYGLPRNENGSMMKDAFIALFIHDIDALNGRELLYLTKIN